MSNFSLHLPPLADIQPALYNILMASPTTAGLASILERETVLHIGREGEDGSPFTLRVYDEESDFFTTSHWKLPENLDDWKLLFEVPNSVILDDNQGEIDPEYLWGLISREGTIIDNQDF